MTCLFLLLTSLVSCGQKAQTKVNATVSILGNLISGDLALVDGGIMFFGKNQTTGEYFSRKLDPQTELTLSNGQWDFAAMAWNDEAFVGATRCAINFGVSLRGGDIDVNFNLNTTTCNNTLFAPASTRAAGGAIKPLEITNCSNVNGLYNNYDSDSCKRGIFQGYKIVFPEVFPGGNFNTGANSIQSLCKGHAAGSTSDIFASTVKLPIITFPGGPSITTIVSGYDTNTCNGYREDFIFDRKPIMAGINYRAKFNEQDNTKNSLTLVSNNCASPVVLTATPFAQSETISGEIQNLICTPAQFAAMLGSASSATYYLGQNITLSTTIIAPAFSAAPFTGKLLGFEHIISNLNLNFPAGSTQALFASTNGAKIKNITFNNAQYSIASNASNSNSGILIGALGDSTEVRNVNFNNPSMTINCTSACNGFGIIAGSANASTNALSSQISENVITNPILSLGTGTGETGALIGKVQNNIYVRSNKLSNVIIRSNNLTEVIGPNIGGAIGSVAPSSAAMGSEVWGLDVNTNIDHSVNPIYVTTNIGGAIGSIGTGVIHEARLNNIKVTGVIKIPQSGDIYIGGFAGYIIAHQNIDNIITNVLIDTPSASFVGGIVGKYYTTASAPSPIRNVRSFGAINCNGTCGGAFGYLGSTFATYLENAFSRSNITASLHNIGGLIGIFTPTTAGSIQRSFASGNVLGVSGTSTNVGGLIGSIPNSANHNLTDLYADGTVQGQSASTGLLIGSAQSNTSNFARILGLGTGPNTELIGACAGMCLPSNSTVLRPQIVGSFAHNFPLSKTMSTPSGNWDAGSNSPSLISGASCTIGNYYIVSIGGGTNINGMVSWDSADIIYCTSFGYFKPNNPNYGTHGLNGTISTANLASIASYTGIAGNSNWYAGTNHPLLKWAYPISILGEQTLGTNEDPFLLYNYAQWNAIGDNENLMTANFKLIDNIDFSSQTFIPIGSAVSPFFGTFMGNNKTIKNIVNYSNATGPIGIFRSLGAGTFGPAAQIEHRDENTNTSYKLTLENINFTQNSASPAGILVGEVNDGATDQFKAIKIINVEIINSTLNGSASSAALGGLIGQLNVQNPGTQISNIISDVTIGNCNTGNIGGVIGSIAQIGAPVSVITFEYWKSFSDINCALTGNTNVGGMVGIANGALLRFNGLLFDGSVTGNASVGGVFGQLTGESTVSYSKGTIIGTTQVGGVVGWLSSGSISGTYTTANVTGTTVTGSFGGKLSSAIIDNSYAFNNLSSTNLFVATVMTPSCANAGMCNNHHVGGSANQNSGYFLSTNISLASIANPSVDLDAGSPWFFDGVGLPKIIPEVFPEYFNN